MGAASHYFLLLVQTVFTEVFQTMCDLCFLYFSQISQPVTTTQTSVTQTTVMETVTMVTTREQILVKHAKEELPPPPPHKKRQLLVDSEIRKR